MCYIVKERKTGLMSSTTIRQGHYHHVYGVDTSSTASPSAYIRSVMSLAGQPSETPAGKKKSSKVRVISATYCAYDMVTRRDIRIEICFPGSTNVIAFD